jgi:hypothetical protein
MIEVIKPILERYDLILESLSKEIVCEEDPGTSYAHLRWMIVEMSKGEMPIDKLNRWLGFIQGIMIERKLLTVPGERNATREIFKGKSYE